MKTKICPVCDQVIKGSYCKNCHKFVKPVEFDSSFRLNESQISGDYFEIQMEEGKGTKREPNRCYSSHPAPNRPGKTEQREPNRCYTPHLKPNQQGSQVRNPNQSYPSRSAANQTAGRQTSSGSSYGGAARTGAPGERSKKPVKIMIIVFIIIAVIQFLLPIIIGLTTMTGNLFEDMVQKTEEIPEEDDGGYTQITLEEAKEFGDSSTGLTSMDLEGEAFCQRLADFLDEAGMEWEYRETEDLYKMKSLETGEMATYCSVYYDYSLSEEEYVAVRKDALSGKLISVSFVVQDYELASRLAAQVMMEAEGIGEKKALKRLDITEERLEDYYSEVFDGISYFGYNDGEDEFAFLISSEE